MSPRNDLPLSDDSTTRLVPWIVGVMAYLAALALAAALTLSNVAREWSEGLEGSLTVQIPAAADDNPKTTDARIVAAVRVLLKTDGVDSARPIPLAEIGKMLEPWLGSAAATAELPLPRVIDVRLKSDAAIDYDALSARLTKAVPGASLETHEKWRNTLLLLFRSIEAVAIVVILLISAVALAAIVLTTRSVLAVHYEIVELLHLIGAQDTYIAKQFQTHAFRLALKGSVGGTVCAIATLLGIVQLTGDLDASLLPPTTLAYWHWPVLALLPAAEAYGAMFTARLTILRALRRMG
ncbi:MAG: cell division protein [Alphaproteobacteria bacterium]